MRVPFRRGAVGWLLLPFLAGGPRVHPVEAPDASALTLSSDLRVAVEDGRRIELDVRPARGEGYAAIARRVCGSSERGQDLEWRNEGAPTPERWVRVPLGCLSEEYRSLVLRNLFPGDRLEGSNWVHVARAGTLSTYGEGMWQVAEWFTGNGARFPELLRANGLSSPELASGQVIRIPAGLLHPALAARPRSEDGALEYGQDPEGPYAGYRLKAGEALYSAVVLQFTGRTDAEDVSAIAEALARRSGIRDVRDIPIGFLVKIPFDLLEPDFLPRDDPRHREADAARAELARELARDPLPTARRGLDGVVVILDPGHGGRDAGTTSHGIREHEHVYDIACRLKRRLERETLARVFQTLRDGKDGCEPSEADRLSPRLRGAILTTPNFVPQGGEGETAMGVHLRWYLANSIYRRARTDGFDPERVVFVSLHADARHPSLRGVMIYVPGSRYRQETFGKSGAEYRRFREVREQPRVSFTRKDRVRSEAISRQLAAHMVEAFRREGLPVQPYQPVRDRIIRGRRTWLPAVLKGNAVPAKVLVELVNLNNAADARLLSSALQRERLAAGLLASIRSFCQADPPQGTATRASRASP